MKTRAPNSLAFLTLLVWLFLIVDALLPQLQLMVVHKIIISSIVIKIGMILLVALTNISIRRRYVVCRERAPVFLKISTIFFIVYLLFEVIIFTSTGSLSFSSNYVLYSYEVYYYSLFLAPLAYAFRKSLDESYVVALVLIALIPLAVLGIAQSVLHTPIVATSSGTSSFEVFSLSYMKSFRAFSLFTSGLMFGHFLVLCFLFLVVRIGKTQNAVSRILILTLLLLDVWAMFDTFTRNVYIELLLSVLSLIVIATYKRSRIGMLTKLIPVLYGSVALYVAYFPIHFGFKPNLSSTLSLMIRRQEWQQWWVLWSGKDIMTFLFGTGYVQSGKFTVLSAPPIDNSFLAVAVQIGAIGILIWFLIMWALWIYAVKQAIEHKSVVTMSVAAYISAWIATGMFNVDFATYGVVFLLIPLTNTSRLRHSNRQAPQYDGLSKRSRHRLDNRLANYIIHS